MEGDFKNFKEKIRPIIFWEGFPVCGLLLKKVADEFRENLIIVTTRPKIPFIGLEEILEHKIIWLDDANDIWKRKKEFGDRNFIIHAEWIYEGWLKYDQYMKKHYGAKIVLAADNRYRGDFRQFVGALWFRLYLKKYFDAVLVPGKSGRKLMEFLGMDKSKIYIGLYGAYEGIYKDANPIQNRNKEFLFIGQLIKRKAVDVLIPSFKKYQKEGGTWNLRIVGDGPLKDICNGDGIILEPFAQPQEIAIKMNQARVLVLPSKDDNWGTVVCEAAACGMHIISAKTVGASADIIQDGLNGIVLENISSFDLQKAFFYYENLPENSLVRGSRVSKEIASKYNSETYYQAFKKMVCDLR